MWMWAYPLVGGSTPTAPLRWHLTPQFRHSTALQLPTTTVMPCYRRIMLAAITSNVVITGWLSFGLHRWSVGVCECGVGDKAVSGEEHSQSTILIHLKETL